MALTLTTDIGSAATTAYNLVTYDTLRSDAVYSTAMISKVQPTALSHRGDTVKFWFRADLGTLVSPLTESSDPVAQNISDSSVDVGIDEYGGVVGYTNAAEGTDMLKVDMNVAIANANQAVDSFDELARTALMGGTQVDFIGGTTQATIPSTGILDAISVQTAVAKLRDASVKTLGDQKYLGIISPYTSIDLRTETGDAAWVTSRNYQDISGINGGFVGTFGGVMFYETPRVPLIADGGVTTTDVYQNVIVGQEALACAYAENVSGPSPEAVVSPVTDKLKRFHHVGWKWFGGFDTFRQASCWRLESASSIGAN